jgi:perosamine synthetase
MDLLELAQERDLFLVEDAAQALGTRVGGQQVGRFGIASCLSFWEEKAITSAGEGGMIITNEAAVAARARRLREHGETEHPTDRLYHHAELGFNYRMTAVQAAVGLSQLGRLDTFVTRRRKQAGQLTSALELIDGIDPPVEARYATHAYWKYVARLLHDRLRVAREDVISAVVAEGIPVAPRYPIPLHRQPVFAHYANRNVTLPVADELSNSLIAIPVHPSIGDRDLDDVVDAIHKVMSVLQR